MEITVPFCRRSDGVRTDAVEVERFVERNHTPCQIERAGRELAVLPAEAANARQGVVDEKLSPKHSHLEHGADILGEPLRCDDRFRTGQLAAEILRVVVTCRFVFASCLVADEQGAGIEVGAGAFGNLVVETLERTFDDSIVAVEEDDVFASRHVDAGVAGGGA